MKICKNMDFTIGCKAAGRVVFELYTDITPKTAENFRPCAGEYRQAKLSRKKLHYLGCKVHRIVDDFVIQAGDIVNADGSGGESIYGTKHFLMRISLVGMLMLAYYQWPTEEKILTALSSSLPWSKLHSLTATTSFLDRLFLKSRSSVLLLESQPTTMSTLGFLSIYLTVVSWMTRIDLWEGLGWRPSRLW